MMSDVCKHCATRRCLEACPTGALFRTEFDTVVVQQDICNGCGYCVPACPFGVVDARPRRRQGAQMHAVLRPPERRPRAGVRQIVPDQLDPVRRRSTSCTQRAGERVDGSAAAQGVASAYLYGVEGADGSPGSDRRHRRPARVLPADGPTRGLQPATRRRRCPPARAARSAARARDNGGRRRRHRRAVLGRYGRVAERRRTPYGRHAVDVLGSVPSADASPTYYGQRRAQADATGAG